MIIPTITLFAQTVSVPVPEPDVLVGGAGWVGAGVLGGVLFWLFYRHLPAKDEMLERFIAAKDAQIVSLVRDQKESVSVFMNYVKDRDKEDVAVQSIRDQALRQLGDNCHAFQRDLADRSEATLEKVAEALDRNSQAFGRAVETMDKLEDTITRLNEKNTRRG